MIAQCFVLIWALVLSFVQVATSAPAAKQSYQVGETAELNGLKITVNEAKESAGNQSIKPEAGKHFIIINVTVENTTDKDVSMYSVLQMELKDDTGQASKYQKRPRGSDGFSRTCSVADA